MNAPNTVFTQMQLSSSKRFPLWLVLAIVIALISFAGVWVFQMMQADGTEAKPIKLSAESREKQSIGVAIRDTKNSSSVLQIQSYIHKDTKMASIYIGLPEESKYPSTLFMPLRTSGPDLEYGKWGFWSATEECFSFKLDQFPRTSAKWLLTVDVLDKEGAHAYKVYFQF